MSVTVMADVWRLDLATTDKLVLLALADHAHDDGTRCWPGVSRLAHKTGCSRRTVQRSLAAMRETGVLEAVAFTDGGRGKATEYRIHTVKGDIMTPFTPVERVTPVTVRVTPVTVKGVSVTPQPLVTIIEPSEDLPTRNGLATTRPPDLIWELLTAACGQPATNSERGRYNKAAKDIRESGITPEQLTQAINEYRRRWCTGRNPIDITPTGIAANLGSLTRPKTGGVDDFLNRINQTLA